LGSSVICLDDDDSANSLYDEIIETGNTPPPRVTPSRVNKPPGLEVISLSDTETDNESCEIEPKVTPTVDLEDILSYDFLADSSGTNSDQDL